MRTSKLEKFQEHRRLGGHALSKKRVSVATRRSYWRRKLRAAGVPEADLEETVSRLLHYRGQHRYNARHAELKSEKNRKYRETHREHIRKYSREWYAKRQREDRARTTLAIGGIA